MTNISLDKLPPITDDKVRLPEASPSSPLVKVSPSGVNVVITFWRFSLIFCENKKAKVATIFSP
jgi:hypothetical protein